MKKARKLDLMSTVSFLRVEEFSKRTNSRLYYLKNLRVKDAL